MILDGKIVAEKILQDTSLRLAQKDKKPHLRVILVGENPASEIYVRNKIRTAEKLHVDYQIDRFPDSISQHDLIAHIRHLADTPQVTAILVQMPLPSHINTHAILEEIPATKDADGFHPLNFGKTLAGMKNSIAPCTARGVLELLRFYEAPLTGAEVVVIGKSNIVGKPIGIMLANAEATITLCHKQTKDLALHTRRADILVVAAGKENLITKDMVKPGAFVIDVGINRRANGTICGDCDFENIKNIAHISPVPGGVGPLTIACLFANIVDLLS